MRLALAIASFIVLIVHGMVFFDQFFHDWEKHQVAYFGQARSLARSDAERAALDARRPRIEQILVTQFGEMRVDRCVTCHIASDDPRFKEHFKPLRTHSYSESLGDVFRNGRWERRHKFADFGCTVCHGGQGRGLEPVYAHGEDHYWPEPLLGYITQATWRREFRPNLRGKEYLEANCAQCHTQKEFAGTPTVNLGRRLFFQKNCYGCHRIEGLSDGALGPDLTESGKQFKVDYLWEAIVEPRANLATSFMPRFNLTDQEVKALVVFLKSRRGLNFAETSLERYRARLAEQQPEEPPAAKTPAGAPRTAARGERLAREHACAACHRLAGQDGQIAPDLTFVGLLRSEQWIKEHFDNPRALVPDSIMPSFGFPDEDFRAMSLYLASLKAAPVGKDAVETYKNLCARCHGDAGGGNGVTALYLDPAPRDLTKVSFMNSKPEDRFAESLRRGVPGTSMPPWERVLNEEQIRAMLALIWQEFVREPRRALPKRAVPDKNPSPLSAESVRRGEATYLRRCTGCHGRKADGKGPNSLDIVPRPRNLLNSAFVSATGDRRLMESILYGVQGTAMPPWIDYGFSSADAGDLVNYIRSLNKREAPAAALPVAPPPGG